MSCTMLCARPHMALPIRKMTIATWKMRLRPYRSLILPYSGVVAVEVSRYDVTTQL